MHTHIHMHIFVHAQSLYISMCLQAYGQHYVGPRIFNQKSYERLATQCLPLLTTSGVPLTIKGLHHLQSNRLVVNAKKARKKLKQVSEYSESFLAPSISMTGESNLNYAIVT